MRQYLLVQNSPSDNTTVLWVVAKVLLGLLAKVKRAHLKVLRALLNHMFLLFYTPILTPGKGTFPTMVSFGQSLKHCMLYKR